MSLAGGRFQWALPTFKSDGIQTRVEGGVSNVFS